MGFFFPLSLSPLGECSIQAGCSRNAKMLTGSCSLVPLCLCWSSSPWCFCLDSVKTTGRKMKVSDRQKSHLRIPQYHGCDARVFFFLILLRVTCKGFLQRENARLVTILVSLQCLEEPGKKVRFFLFPSQISVYFVSVIEVSFDFFFLKDTGPWKN